MSSNCSKSTQIENRDTMEEFFHYVILFLTIELQNTSKQGHYGGNYNKRFNRATIEEITTKDSNRATMEEIITKE